MIKTLYGIYRSAFMILICASFLGIALYVWPALGIGFAVISIPFLINECAEFF